MNDLYFRLNGNGVYLGVLFVADLILVATETPKLLGISDP
jgi:hypothetical protein